MSKKHKSKTSAQSLAARNAFAEAQAMYMPCVTSDLKDTLQTKINRNRQDSIKIVKVKMPTTQFRQVALIAKIEVRFPFYKIDTDIRVEKVIDQPMNPTDVAAWKLTIKKAATQLADVLASRIIENGNQYLNGKRPQQHFTAALYHDSELGENDAYSVEKLLSSMQQHITKAVSEGMLETKRKAVSTSNVIPDLGEKFAFHEVQYHLKKVTFTELSIKKGASPPKLILEGNLQYCLDSVKKADAPFNIDLPIQVPDKTPTQVNEAAKAIVDAAIPLIKKEACEFQKKFSACVSDTVSESEFQLPIMLQNRIAMLGRNCANVETTTQISVAAMNAKNSVARGKYGFALAKDGSLNLFKGDCMSPSAVLSYASCDFRPALEKHLMYLPAYQEDLFRFAVFFQRQYDAFIERYADLKLKRKKFQLMLENCCDLKEKDALEPASVTRTCAKLHIRVFAQKKRGFEEIDEWHYQTRNGGAKYSTAQVERMLDDLFVNLYDTELSAARAKIIMPQIQKMYNQLNYPERVVLHYFVGETIRHSITHTAKELKSHYDERSLSNESTYNAILSLEKKRIDCGDHSTKLLVMDTLEGDYGYFDVYSVSSELREYLAQLPMLDKPSGEDLNYLDRTVHEDIIKKWANRAVTSEQRWDALAALTSYNNKAGVARFVKSNEGKNFFGRLERDERAFIGMYLEQVDGCKQIAKELLA